MFGWLRAATARASCSKRRRRSVSFVGHTPPQAGPPPHRHSREDESFYVLEGEYEFVLGGQTIHAPGRHVFVWSARCGSQFQERGNDASAYSDRCAARGS